MRRRDAETLAPLTDSAGGGWPGLLEHNEAPFETFDDALQRLGAIPGETLLDALQRDPDVASGDPSWDPLRRDPDAWMRRYVDALFRAWRGLEPLWRQSTTLFEQEVERIEGALDRGVPTTQLVTDVRPSRTSLSEGELRLDLLAEPRALAVPARGIIFAPMIAGGAAILSTPGDTLVRLAYSLPESWRAFDNDAPPPASLEALLGRHRAALLRHLERPGGAGDVAAALGLRPSGATFHFRALEAAGLIVRERRGRNVTVRRTDRGHILVALYQQL